MERAFARSMGCMSTRIRTESQGPHVREIILDRAAKRNAFDLAMLREVAEAFTAAEDDPAVRAIVVSADGPHFTAGLDLAEVGPAVASGGRLFPEGNVDPLGLNGRVRTKPFLLAARGWCLTIGIELALAADIVVLGDDAKLGQIEIKRGIFPFGGATMRLPARAGWGNAMRWLLTGDTFDAVEAARIGLVQEVVRTGEDRSRALAIAETIAKQAPLGVRATLESARRSQADGEAAAAAALLEQARALMGTEDAAEGVRSFVERREGKFVGR